MKILMNLRDFKMYCLDHTAIMRCCSMELSNCKICDKEFLTAMAPPVNDVCEECSEKFHVCELCGVDVE